MNRTILIVALACVSAIATAQSSSHQKNIPAEHASRKAASQGNQHTSNMSGNHKDVMETTAGNSGQNTPREAQSGLATGRRMHKPLTISKEDDAVSPGAAKPSGHGQSKDIQVNKETDASSTK